MANVTQGHLAVCGICDRHATGGRLDQCVGCDRSMAMCCNSDIPNWQSDVCQDCAPVARRFLTEVTRRLNAHVLIDLT